MAALLFLLDTLLSLSQFVVLLRLLLQWARADFRNPLLRAIVQLSNPLLVPLRRVLPAIGRLDTASVLIVLALALLRAYVPVLLHLSEPLPLLALAVKAALGLLVTLLWIYFYAIFLYALLSLIAPGTYSPAQALLTTLCEPVLRPLRRLIPPLANLDLSPLWAGILIIALLKLLP
ncbi:MAG: YggT family protein [Gammaproteobacteria bacterium]|nr:YggT family protein [Gammaproteobacteria bacterium]